MKSNVIAIDIGSANTNVYKLGEGIVLFEASAIALSTAQRGKIKAVGDNAKRLHGRTAGTSAVIFPIVEGQVADEKSATLMLENFINKITLSRFGFRPQAVVAVRCGLESVEIKKFENMLKSVGIYSTSFIESPILTALGLNVPISESTPCFIVDIGGGTTNIAAVSLDGVICGLSIDIGGKVLDNMIFEYISEQKNLKIGTATAEKIKIEIGSLIKGDEQVISVNGGNTQTGKPTTVSITSSELRPVVSIFFNKIFEYIEMVIAKLPAEVAAEIRSSGIYFAGGTSKIPGLEYYAKEKLAINATCFDNPENATVVGGGIVAGDKNLLKRLRIQKR